MGADMAQHPLLVLGELEVVEGPTLRHLYDLARDRARQRHVAGAGNGRRVDRFPGAFEPRKLPNRLADVPGTGLVGGGVAGEIPLGL